MRSNKETAWPVNISYLTEKYLKTKSTLQQTLNCSCSISTVFPQCLLQLPVPCSTTALAIAHLVDQLASISQHVPSRGVQVTSPTRPIPIANDAYPYLYQMVPKVSTQHDPTYGTHRPNVIWLDFDFECRQVDSSQRFEGELTSRNMEIDLRQLQSDLGNKWRNTNWIKISARFSMRYGTCMHVACLLYLLFANATVKCKVVLKNSTKWQKLKTFSIYTVSEKTWCWTFCNNLHQLSTNFENSFTVGNSSDLPAT